MSLTVTDTSGTTSYTYDALNQLTGVSGSDLSETYTYDATGNRLTKGGVTYTYNTAGQLVSASDGTGYTYDAAGNLRTRTKAGQTTTYSWDAVGRLTRIDFPDATYAAYGYDELGQRISKRDHAGVMTYYVYDGMNLVQEVNAERGGCRSLCARRPRPVGQHDARGRNVSLPPRSPGQRDRADGRRGDAGHPLSL